MNSGDKGVWEDRGGGPVQKAWHSMRVILGGGVCAGRVAEDSFGG